MSLTSSGGSFGSPKARKKDLDTAWTTVKSPKNPGNTPPESFCNFLLFRMIPKKFEVVIIGGGIAAVECVNQLKLELLDRDASIALVTGGSYVKRIKNMEILSSGLVGM